MGWYEMAFSSPDRLTTRLAPRFLSYLWRGEIGDSLVIGGSLVGHWSFSLGAGCPLESAGEGAREHERTDVFGRSGVGRPPGRPGCTLGVHLPNRPGHWVAPRTREVPRRDRAGGRLYHSNRRPYGVPPPRPRRPGRRRVLRGRPGEHERHIRKQSAGGA